VKRLKGSSKNKVSLRMSPRMKQSDAFVEIASPLANGSQ